MNILACYRGLKPETIKSEIIKKKNRAMKFE